MTQWTNRQKHIVDVKKISSLVSRFITTCLCAADRRGDQSFLGHRLRPKIFVWIRLKLKITHFINLTGHPKCQIWEISEWFDTKDMYFIAKSMPVWTIHENKPQQPRTKTDNLRYGPPRTVRMVGERLLALSLIYIGFSQSYIERNVVSTDNCLIMQIDALFTTVRSTFYWQWCHKTETWKMSDYWMKKGNDQK